AGFSDMPILHSRGTSGSGCEAVVRFGGGVRGGGCHGDEKCCGNCSRQEAFRGSYHGFSLLFGEILIEFITDFNLRAIVLSQGVGG
ncbi:hypothetical protein ACFWCQ_35645, partial [Streptomyces cyaneofuscatus]|uniref:hypothetical protein n=1 Tax=Streptomyces cyaneofuscatus TaxID=66883 RepID=UPI00364FEB10